MEQNHTPERIINLTLEIIYQLTGEDWENVEGHEEVYRNITVENQPPLTSPDESRNTPERCPHPLFSQDSTQEHQEIPQEDQDKNHIIYGIETREEAEDPYVMGDDRCKEEELPPEFSTDPSGSESKVKDEDKEEAHVNIKEERIPIEISTVGSSNRNTLKTCSSSLSSLELTQNYDKIPQKEKDTNLVTIKQEEEKITRGDDPCKKEPNLSEIGSDGRYKRCNTEEHPSVLSQDSDVPNNTQGGTFLDRSSIITVHLEMGMFPCSRCGERFNSRDELTAHQRSNHGPGRTYACPECGKSFTQKYVLRRHQAWHSGDTPFSCSVCGKCFVQKSDVIRHQKTHTGEKPFSCLKCGKCFSWKSNLISHEKLHTRVNLYCCSVCGKCFRVGPSLIAHERTHRAEKPYSCSGCGKSFTQKRNLISHQKKHLGEKPHISCAECGKCFKWQKELLRHQKSHRGEKPFSCSECGKCFTEKSNLVSHERSHRAEKPFSCSECGKCFTRKETLTVHQRSHTGEKPFSCGECGKCFSRRSYLLNHEKVHRR